MKMVMMRNMIQCQCLAEAPQFPEVSSFLEHCSRPHTDRIAEEFQHGFSLQTPKEAQQKLYGF